MSFDELIGPIAQKARHLGESLGKNLLFTLEGGHLTIDKILGAGTSVRILIPDAVIGIEQRKLA